MDSLQDTGFQGAVETVGFSEQIAAKQSQALSETKKVTSVTFKREQLSLASIMKSIGPVQRRFEEKITQFDQKESVFPPRLCKGVHMHMERFNELGIE